MTWVEADLSALRSEFPTHDIWHMRAYLGPDSWCSKPKDVRAGTSVAHSPDELRSDIKAELEEMGTLSALRRWPHCPETSMADPLARR